MARRTKEGAQETRNHILDTAEQAFHDKGVSHTTLAEIAKAADLTRGAIYWHFKNKLDLFQAMMDRVTLPMEHAFASGATELEHPLTFIRNCSLGVLKQVTSDPQSQRVFEICCHKVEYVDEMSQLRTRHIACRTSFLTHIEHGFKQAFKQGLIPATVNPRFAAVGLHALVDGLIMNWVLDPKYFPLSKAAESIIDAYLNSLALPQKTPKSVKKTPTKRPTAKIKRP